MWYVGVDPAYTGGAVVVTDRECNVKWYYTWDKVTTSVGVMESANATRVLRESFPEGMLTIEKPYQILLYLQDSLSALRQPLPHHVPKAGKHTRIYPLNIFL